MTGRPPIHYARGKPEVMQVLIRSGANLNLQYPNSGTYLHSAVSASDLVSATILLKAKANANAPMWKTKQTPLHLAVGRNEEAMVRLLLQHGANPNLKDREGKTPVDLARESEFAEVLRLRKK